MTQWIETKLRYDKAMENGAVKKVTEAYLVDALSFAEAEARITKEMESHISGSFEVKAVKKAKIAEVIPADGGGWWYKVRAMFISLDERSGADKLTSHDFMVEAGDIEEAIATFKSEINLMVDYKIAGITETGIMDVFPAKLSNDK
ncbi:MAG: DUF4494 domain-containing protein [Lepagella sp.]